jgi:putative DNA primase/helicase
LDAVITNWNGQQRQWADVDDVLLCLHLQRNIGLTRISVGQAHDAALLAAMHHKKNECKEWLLSLRWDGIERLPYLLSDGFGAEFNNYTQAVGRCWMVSMVARAMLPGCKVDTVPVLEGKQGKQKSSALSVIGGKWFVECHESVMSKDFFGVLKGHLLVEISEMHSFSRSEIERIKGIISCQVDRYRKAYGRHTEDHPRQTVLVGTTNRDDYHKDDTGGRRFLPVMCKEISLNWLRENRDQLFAEAMGRFMRVPFNAIPEDRKSAGAAWWDIPEEDQKNEIDSRRDVDSWETVIDDWLSANARTRVYVSDILIDCLGIDVKDHDPLKQKRVARVLRALGWVSKVKRTDDGKNKRTWTFNEDMIP